LKPTKFVRAANKIIYHPSHPTCFFATQILGGQVTSRNQGLSSNDQGRQRRETLGTRLCFFLLSLRSLGKSYRHPPQEEVFESPGFPLNTGVGEHQGFQAGLNIRRIHKAT